MRSDACVAHKMLSTAQHSTAQHSTAQHSTAMVDAGVEADAYQSGKAKKKKKKKKNQLAGRFVSSPRAVHTNHVWDTQMACNVCVRVKLSSLAMMRLETSVISSNE